MPRSVSALEIDACSWLMSLRSWTSLARSRIFWTATIVMPTRMAMIATTTSNSISVKAVRPCRGPWLRVMVFRPPRCRPDPSPRPPPPSGEGEGYHRSPFPLREGGRGLGLFRPRSFAQAVQQLQQRHEQGDDDGADDETQHHDHHRLQQADQALDQHVDFL